MGNASSPGLPKTIVVVTPVMNAVSFIDETIRSVISQTGNFSIRYHIQDGGSSDGTVELLKRWEWKLRGGNPLGGANVRFTWVSERDRGMYNAINKGFKHVEPEFAQAGTEVVALTWINSDDILLNNSLKTILDYFTKNPATQWVTGVSTLMTEAGTLADTSLAPTAFRKPLSQTDNMTGAAYLSFSRKEHFFDRTYGTWLMD